MTALSYLAPEDSRGYRGGFRVFRYRLKGYTSSFRGLTWWVSGSTGGDFLFFLLLIVILIFFFWGGGVKHKPLL